MADLSLQADSACATSVSEQLAPALAHTSYALYAAFRWTQAKWDAHIYDPARPETEGEDPADAVLCHQTARALDSFMLHPVTSLADLTRKLRVFRDHEIHDGWENAGEIVHVLVQDAQRLLDGEAS